MECKLGAGGEGDDRGWDGWMASPTSWTWVWVNSRSWWWTGRPGLLWFTGSQRVGHDWATELNWSDIAYSKTYIAKLSGFPAEKVWRYTFSHTECACVCVWGGGVSCVWLFATAWPVMEFSRQEYWSGLPFPSPGDLPNSGIKPRSPAL